MALLGFYHDSIPYTSPVTSIHAGACHDRIVRERVHKAGTQEEKSTKILGCVRVQATAACMAVKCFIHCAMPLRLPRTIIINQLV